MEYGVGYTLNSDNDGINYFYFDLEDFDKIKDYYWKYNAYGYLVADSQKKHNTKQILLHRLVLNAENGFVVDHKNHKRYDNRKNNLRQCTYTDNCRNRILQCNNHTSHTGVCWAKREHKYRSDIVVNNKHIHLGYYDNLEDAIAARKEAEEKYFGEYSYNNSIGTKEKDEE